ncbi:MAG TPA: 4Fe-4S dicluster domain-containing protein [Gemmatimonadaceae bacterium]|nr:4Fe-4S dicluster domain-containing protein [Gemmatimonadaceae bacterium]
MIAFTGRTEDKSSRHMEAIGHPTQPWIGAPQGAPVTEDTTVPVTQEAQRTAGTRIEPGRAYGFFTDTTLCIGCKACEVACKQWNNLPAEDFELSGDSYDNTRELSATTWRHVEFIEQFDAERFDGLEPPALKPEALRPDARGLRANLPTDFEPWANLTASEQWSRPGQRWIFMSDVCKHCVDAPCLEACPTGSIIRTEFDSVYVQQDVCNGCGYCVSACPFGVIDVASDWDGKAHKCTLCYDRLKDGLEPACAKACPTDSIQFGPVDELLHRAQERVRELRERGIPAYLYGTDGVMENECDTSRLEGLNCFFLLIDRPEVYNLPAVPKRPSTNTGVGLATSALAALGLTAAALVAFAGGGDGR